MLITFMANKIPTLEFYVFSLEISKFVSNASTSLRNYANSFDLTSKKQHGVMNTSFKKKVKLSLAVHQLVFINPQFHFLMVNYKLLVAVIFYYRIKIYT